MQLDCNCIAEREQHLLASDNLLHKPEPQTALLQIATMQLLVGGIQEMTNYTQETMFDTIIFPVEDRAETKNNK